MARRCYRELLRGKARDQADDQLQERINDLRALAEVLVDIYLAGPEFVPAADSTDEPGPSRLPSVEEDIEDYADALVSAGIPLAEARKLARTNQALVEMDKS